MFSRFNLVLKSYRIFSSSVLFSLKERYSGSVLGILWLFLIPVLFTSVYSSVYAMYLGGNENKLISVISVLCGLLPFLAFAESVGQGTSSVVNSSSLLKNTLFPVELAPLRDVTVAHISMLPALLMLLAAGVYQSGDFNFYFLLIFPIYFMQLIFVVGVVYILATLNVFIRDVSKVMPIFLLFMMLITPIGMDLEDVPENYRIVFSSNPLTFFVELYRKVMMGGEVQVLSLLTIFALSVVTFTIGFFIISKLRAVFVDYV